MTVCRHWYSVIILVSMLGVSAKPVSAQGQFTLAVLNLDAKGVSNVEAEILSDELRHQLNVVSGSEEYRSGGMDAYQMVERTEMDRLLAEFEFEYMGCVSDSCALELGRMLQVDRLVIGTVGLLGSTYTLSIRMIDVETAKTLNTASMYHRGEIDGLLTDITPVISHDLLYGTTTVQPQQQSPVERELAGDQTLMRSSAESVKLKSTGTAFALNFIPPVILPIQGLGHYYNGEKTKGHLSLLLGLSSFAMLVAGSKEEADPLTGEMEPRNPSAAGIGALIYIVNWISSSVDSYRSAKRINQSRTAYSSPPTLGFAVQQDNRYDSTPVPMLVFSRSF